ncbi:MAG TPA: indolepyruvate oxidoreductase subunit beta family protein [Hyphomicrobiales bacterium]|nr:indolepyruvate oxidoreductase subunit beta family protein [Hyphomicrobiales bacterium]
MNPPAVPSAEGDRVIRLAILAVGGQGGGVLCDWIVDLAERNGWLAQATSVAGVAQRTGATVYYVEMCPDRGRRPVFALAPAPGDVDILVAAEMMEAGRAILRGFVTPDRTTLIASSHRIAAVSEKVVPGDGRGAPQDVEAAAKKAAKAWLAFDMEKIAAEAGSFISASLFGGLAGTGVLPFARASFAETIRASGGRGVEASLRAFTVACDEAERRVAAPVTAAALPGTTAAATHVEQVAGSPALVAAWREIEARIAKMPEPVRAMAGRGARKVVDYQDLAYGREYLDRLDRALARDDAARGWTLSLAAAKYLANAMCYDDIVRVADLKTRGTRSERVRREIGVAADGVLQVTEYFHPRIEEVCGTLPAGLGAWIEARPGLARWLDRRINKDRRLRTDRLATFALLWTIGGMRRWRRGLLRHRVETAHLEGWYTLSLERAPRQYDLAVEILACRRLIKGYSDTHARGLSKFDRVLSALPLLDGRADAADWLRRLREAALKDEKGTALDGALKTVASFAAPATAAGARPA